MWTSPGDVGADAPEPQGAFRAPVREVARDVCALVESTWNTHSVAQPEDRATLDLLLGYSAAFGQVEAILRDAEADDADATAAHARTLVSVILKSLWLVQSEDPTERERRRRSQNRVFYEAALKRANHLQQVGFDDGSIDRAAIGNALASNEAWFATEAAELGRTVAVDRCDEATIAGRLGLPAFYAMTYREASDAIHFGRGSLLNRITLEDDGERAHVDLRPADAATADRLLGQSLLIYGHFLNSSRDHLHHGIAAEQISMTLFGTPDLPG